MATREVCGVEDVLDDGHQSSHNSLGRSTGLRVPDEKNART
jgi:hypothetical protein